MRVSSRAVKSSPRAGHRVSHVAHAAALLLLSLVASCSDTRVEPSVTTPGLLPGEICDIDNRPQLRLSFDPPSVVVAPGETRPVRLTVEPDLCEPNVATLVLDNPAIAALLSADPAIAEPPATA